LQRAGNRSFEREAVEMKTRYVLAVAALAVLAAASLAAANPASGPQSVQKASETPQVSVDVARSLTVTPDGKPVVAGLSRKGSRYTWAIARDNGDGKLDPSFGKGGRVLTGFGGGTAYAVATQTDGKLLVAGAGDIDSKGDSGFALARYTVRGHLDPSFGSNGRVLTAFAKIPGDKYSLARVIAVALQPDGKIVAGGWSGGIDFRDFALARYTARGRLDPSFGQGGKVVNALGSQHQAQLAAAALQPDRKIVAVGRALLPTGGATVVARFTTRGELDPSFGQGGRVLTEAGSLDDAPTVVVVQPGGGIVVAGSSNGASGGRFTLLRYTAEGKLDPSFGAGGEVTTDVDPGHSCDPLAGPCSGEVLLALASEPDGKLVAAGMGRGPYFALARYSKDGSLDPSFDQGGTVLADSLGAVLSGVAIQADGKIVTAGTSHGDFALARYTDSGSLDTGFGSGGRSVTAFGPAWRTKLASLSATRVSSGVLVRWRTASEFDARGFYLYRDQNGRRLPANRALIRAKGAGPGAAYSFRDRGAPGSTRRYWLQEVTVDGSLPWLGQIIVRRLPR
jgi:uncharacterized delta-60 repeat protein